MSAALPATTTLQRETFTLSRQLEFFDPVELTKQIGFSQSDWPVALLKELIDNSLDACESANIAPVITVDLRDDELIVADNGPGLPQEVLRQSLDYESRTSDKLGYVGPSRGQQGNALKTVWAAAFAATGEGRIKVETADYAVLITVTLDRIVQKPRLELAEVVTDVKTGTRITLAWRQVSCYLKRPLLPNFYSVTHGVADFNPHCFLATEENSFDATDVAWNHWLPSQPTSPHWYTPEKFRTLIGLLLNNERRGGKARSVNELIREFHGLSSTVKAKAITSQAGLTGAMLHDLIRGDDVDMGKVTALLNAMKTHAKVVKPEALGVLGKEHCQTRLVRYGAAPDSVEYRKASGEANGLPYVLEVAFGIKTDSKYSRTLRIGINFSPALAQPFTALDSAMDNARCQSIDPVVMLVHLSCPAVATSDRGKSKALLPFAIEVELQRLVKLATARFTKAKRQADRNDRMNERDLEELRNAHKERPMTVKEAAYQVMEQAYMKASSNNTLPANARQIMYAARPLIIRLTGNISPWKNTATFTQKHLPNFIAEHPELCQDWDVAFDERGHFEEPHTDRSFGIGTLAVRDYIRGWETDVDNLDVPDSLATKLPTKGPALRYRHALFIEKEGFAPLIGEANIAERYDSDHVYQGNECHRRTAISRNLESGRSDALCTA